jgi:hypothetical protein
MPKVGKTYDFNISLPNKRFKEYDLPLSTKQMNDPAVELMRRHDYYVGWLDSFHARPLPTDEQHPRNAYIAGANAGAVLAWIQYCEKDRADWAVCMFNNHSDMKPIATWKVPAAVLVAKAPLVTSGGDSSMEQRSRNSSLRKNVTRSFLNWRSAQMRVCDAWSVGSEKGKERQKSDGNNPVLRLE